MTNKGKFKLFAGILAVIILVFIILLLIQICNSQANSSTQEIKIEHYYQIQYQKYIKQEEMAKISPEKKPATIQEKKIISEDKTDLPKEEIIMFAVDSQKNWQDTGVIVSADKHIIVEYVKGKWCVGSSGWNNDYVDAEGYTSQQCLNLKIDNILTGTLVGKIGDNKKIKIGNYYEIVDPNMNGNLFLKINDFDGLLRDNVGTIIVKIIIQYF